MQYTDAELDTNHTLTLNFCSSGAKQEKEKGKTKLQCYYTTFTGDAIALSVRDKLLNL